MTVHLFGATSSLSAANFALKATVDDYEEDFSSAADNFIRNYFYVDDGLKAVSTSDEAVDLIQKSKELCKKGGFNLHKFVSNHTALLAAVNPDERASSIKSLDLSKDTLPIEWTLRIQWCVESDTFQFRFILRTFHYSEEEY